MDALPLFPLLVMSLIAVAGIGGWASARAAREREQARVAFAGGLAVDCLAPLHDHFLRTALDHYAERDLPEGRARIECAVVLRDRIDALEGRANGPLNRSRHRGRLLPGAHRLRGWPHPSRVRDYLERHVLGSTPGTPSVPGGAIASSGLGGTPPPELEPLARRLMAAGGP